MYDFLGLSKPGGVTTSYTISLASPEKMLEMAKLAETEGYKILKIKLGGPHDLEALTAIHRECAAKLRVDANEGWSPDEAVEKILALEELGVELVEQPVPANNLEGLKHVCENTNMPIFADESVKSSSNVESVSGFVDGVNVKLMKCGGIREALEAIETAKEHGLMVMIGCMVESSISITAAAHLTSLADYVDLDGNLLIVNDPYKGVVAEQGVLTLPEQPGLGVEPTQAGGPGASKP
ncbi:MAG: hypothetical protein DRO11_00460 [Methanobacteriota archaeon]|nr:MAG: hypothetical protein DRO11_00460 [Euryarchaeota archaeon]